MYSVSHLQADPGMGGLLESDRKSQESEGGKGGEEEGR